MSSNFWIDKAEEFLLFEHPSERDVLHPLILNKVEIIKPNTYLDFGAGDGRMSQKINSSVPIDIFDISTKMIEKARETLGNRLNKAYKSLEEIPENYYDLIVCSMVLMCIDNEKEIINVLSSIYRSLNKGGVCIFSTTHPCFRESFFSDFYTEYAESGGFNYFKEGKPFEVTIHDQDKSNTVSFEDYHWTLSFTLNKIIENHFSIDELIETSDNTKAETHNKLTSPFIILIARK